MINEKAEVFFVVNLPREALAWCQSRDWLQPEWAVACPHNPWFIEVRCKCLHLAGRIKREWDARSEEAVA